MTQKKVKYSIFSTSWGWFGLAGTQNTLTAAVLPCPNPGTVQKLILQKFPAAEKNDSLFRPLQKRIKAFFSTGTADFSDVKVDLDCLTDFQKAVLKTCRTIKPCHIISYGDLANRIGRPRAGRAVGNALAINPLPLIIPCHRVVCSDGRIGKFSAPGGTKTKLKLLTLEKAKTI